jgi:hypothetical protein
MSPSKSSQKFRCKERREKLRSKFSSELFLYNTTENFDSDIAKDSMGKTQRATRFHFSILTDKALRNL